ncbi:MAG: DUF4276 family protein [Pseudomonadota bacterium]
MKRIIIICEGETEKEFCTTVLSSYLLVNDIYVQAPLIKKSMGGIVKWSELKKQIENHLKNDPTTFVTTLIDYYGLYTKHHFPDWDRAEIEHNRNVRMAILEKGMFDSISVNINYRFLPYIQLHEFEGLLFNDKKYFVEQIPPNELIGIAELDEIFRNYTNPEMINNNRDTSPSHRLDRIIKGYNKIVYGNILAEAIGIDNIRNKSPRFNDWLAKIVNLK